MKKQYNYQQSKRRLNQGLIALIFVMSACGSQPEPAANLTNEPEVEVKDRYELTKIQFESSDMELGSLQQKTFHEVVKATGRFDVPPENRASVSSYFGGTVKDLQLLEGQQVKKGQVLFTLENPDFVQMQQDYLEAKAQLTYLKSDYERQKNLVEDNVSSRKNFLKAESDYNVTSVKVESLSKKLILMNINPTNLTVDNIRTTVQVTSPINGYVTKVDITRGVFLNPSQIAVTIVDTEHLHLELTIFEKDLPKIDVGQAIQFRIQEDKVNVYSAEVLLVNKTVDPTSRTIGVHGHLSDQKMTSKFSPGMYVEADIYSTSINKVSLPEDALVEIDGQSFALVLENASNSGYTLVKKEIIVGETNNGFVEILNQTDFNDSTQFLIKGAFNLITE
jgi:cobalt-zinc-cadmium efflux system membrane fusion protein